MRVTRDTVAKHAKVSSATVSRVFNAPETVSPPLRKQVLCSARQLGYFPNTYAATLRRKGTGTLALVEFPKEGRPYYWGSLAGFDWFYARALRGVQEVIAQSSWQLRFVVVHDKEELQELSTQCDGILAYDVDTSQEVGLFSDITIPYVLSHHLDEGIQAYHVRTDNVYGGMLQAKYLQEQGCSKVLYLTGHLGSVEPHAQRLAGFQNVFPEARVLLTDIGNPESIAAIAKDVQTLMENNEIDGLAAVNDLALFTLLLETKKRVPAIGYDASPFFSVFPRPVASVDIKSKELYRQGAMLLLSLLSGREVESTTVLPQLVMNNRCT